MTAAKSKKDLLTAPTPRAARTVALSLLDALDAAHARLDKKDDQDALHDFRVALRRLRSWLRAYRKELRDSVGKRTQRQLGTLADVTTDSRDLEVHLGWLAARRTSKAKARPGIEWLMGRMKTEKARADAAFRERVAADYSMDIARLRKNLSRHAMAVWEQDSHERWGASAATHIRDAFTTLRRRLSSIRGPEDDEEAHRARIAGKRLRYLLEPLNGVVGGIDACIEHLKVLQDLLGAEHDAHVFSRQVRRAVGHLGRMERSKDGDPRPGLSSLARSLESRRLRSYREFSGEWMEKDFEEVSKRVHAIVLELRAKSGSGVEIERKYLLRKLPVEARRAPKVEIEQGYLPGKRLVERLRRVRGPGGAEYFRTVKSGKGLVRTELEEKTTHAVFSTMWPLTKGRRVKKIRYRLADSGRVWEIDQFMDRKLILAEVELTSASDAVALPDWLARCTVREVTDEPEYVNVNLAR